MADRLVLEKKVGQLLMVGFQGTALSRAQLSRLSRMGIGGVILFKRNYENLAQLIELTNSVQKAITAESFQELPAWVAADQEGGRVIRFAAPFTQFPSMKVWAKSNSPKSCFEAGFCIAKELKAAGVTINFAPVLDVLQNNESNAIGDRSFGEDPEIVSNLGAAYARGLQKGGVLSAGKHFPGHGGVRVDSHLDLPVSEKNAEELDGLDWLPFKRTIRARCDGIMTAHILFPKIDAERLATFSRKILQDYLRKQLRFSKLIFSDDLEMGAITKKYSPTEAAFLAVEAGCDQLLFCQDFDRLEEIWEHLVSAFDAGALPRNRLDESLERIVAAKQKFLLPFKFANIDFAHAMIGNPEFLSVAHAINEGRVIEQGPSAKEGGDS